MIASSHSFGALGNNKKKIHETLQEIRARREEVESQAQKLKEDIVVLEGMLEDDKDGKETKARSSSGGKGRIAVINGLRGWALIHVYFFHYAGMPYFTNIPFYKFGWLHISPYTWLRNGRLGVSMFFVLSGFVLGLPYISGRRNIQSWPDVLTFWKQRCTRLLPLYYFAMLVFYFLQFNGARGESNANGDIWLETFLYITMLYSFIPNHFGPKYLGAFWSLGVEFWYSIIYPGVLVLYKRLGINQTLIMSLVFSHICRSVGIVLGGPRYFWMQNLFGRLDDFVVGMWLSYVYDHRIKLHRCSKDDTKLLKLEEGSLPEVGNGSTRDATIKQRIVVEGVTTFDGTRPSSKHSHTTTQWMWQSVSPGVGFWLSVAVMTFACFLYDSKDMDAVPLWALSFLPPIFTLGSTLCILSLLRMDVHRTNRWIRYAFSAPLIQLIGRMCFSIYVWHGNIDPWVPSTTPNYIALTVLNWFFCIVLFCISYCYIEFPSIPIKKLLSGFPS